MKTVITKTGTPQGSTDVTCTEQVTILRPTFGIGAETEIADIMQRLNELEGRQDQLENNLQNEITVRQQADAAFQLALSNALNYIQQIQASINEQIQILTDLINSFAGIYPKVVMGGSRANSGDVFRPTDSQIDFTDTGHFIVLVCPLGGHEAWDITLYEDHFNIAVFNRSGTRRETYYGDIHYAVIQVLSVPAP